MHIPESVAIITRTSSLPLKDADEVFPEFVSRLRHKYPGLKHFAFSGHSSHVRWASLDYCPPSQPVGTSMFDHFKTVRWAW